MLHVLCTSFEEKHMSVLSQAERRAKLNTLAENEGFTSVTELLEACVHDSVNPGICANPTCDYSTEVEPDQREGWCEECRTSTVQSALVLAGLI
jgi:hypothetical protein